MFVHVSALKASNLKELTDGQAISYELVEFRGREVASNLKLIEVDGNKL